VGTDCPLPKWEFLHSNFVYHPPRFVLGDLSYQPDFYDLTTGEYIEVIGTKQAFHQNKHKYKELKRLVKGVCLLLKNPDGSDYVPTNIVYRKKAGKKRVNKKIVKKVVCFKKEGCGCMRLSAYLHKKYLTPSNFARISGVSQPTIWRIINKGNYFPSAKTVSKIEKATKGWVKFKDMI
jgi:predicted transcriptional regulator